MGIRHINMDACTACGLCIDICPMDVFQENEDGKPVVSYLADCMSCFICEAECPAEAIYVSPARERRVPLPW
jgi:NAD-dependent dihydropyrimidine dehydrogenase PreA subunit